MKKTSDYMTAYPSTIRENAPVASAQTLMAQRGFRHVPVLDADGDVVGIISDRDVQRAMQVRRSGALTQTVSFNPDHRVEDFMSWPVYTILETTPLRLVAEQMLKQKVSAFLVENSAGKLAGIITTDDILRALINGERSATEQETFPLLSRSISSFVQLG